MKTIWKMDVLQDLISFYGKGIVPQYVDQKNCDAIWVLNQKCNTNHKISYGKARYTDIKHKPVSQERYLRIGDIIINATGYGTAGRVAQVDNLIGDTTVDSHMIIIRANYNKVHPKYLAYYMKHNQATIESYAEGSTGQTEISKNRLCYEFKVGYPDLETQKKIAKVLSALDDKIELNNQINKNLEEQAQSIFKRCFIDNEESLHWENATFSNLVVSTISGDWGKDSPSGNNKEEVYCIRGADIPEVQKGNIGKMPIRYILSKNLLSKQLSAGDIVVEISGGSPTQSTGRCASITQSLLNRYGGKMICTNFCRAIKVVPGYSAFVYYYLRYLYDKGTFFAYENGTTGIKNLDLTGFLETESIMIPPKAKIEEFDMLSQSVFSQIYANGKQNDGLSKLRDTLLPKLMSGEIDVDNVEI